MSFPQFMLPLNIILVSVSRSRTTAGIWGLEVGCMRSFLLVLSLWITNCEMSLLDMLGDFFVQLRLILLDFSVLKMIMRERFLGEL